MIHTPVLIVGGSLVGLSASLFLAARGVPHIVVEKHAGSSPHPRAMGFTETTLEHYRAVGIADRIPQAPAGTRLRRVVVESLVSDWTAEQDWTPGEAADRSAELSPCTGAAIAQDKLEPILRQAAVERGADLRLNTELLRFEQHNDGVTAHLRDRSDGRDGREFGIAARYLIAADGATSPIREALGITRSGVGHLRVLRSVLFHCPAADAYLERGAQQFQIVQDDFRAFLTTYGDSRWVLMFEGDEERSTEELQAAIRKALGRDFDFEILTTGRWEMAGRIADRYRAGRVFLAGDAAHQLPPTRGGFGANTGIDDAWNLAWKLQRVIEGSSSPALLDSYEAERRPIGWLRHQQTFSRPDYAPWVGAGFQPDPLFSNDAMEFGQLLRSTAVIGADAQLPAAASPSTWAGQPGTRAPHVAVQWRGRAASTLDAFGDGFALITAHPEWQQIGEQLQLNVLRVGDELVFPPAQSFEATFGVSPEGACLIRPDGVIGWRSIGAPVPGTNDLEIALRQIAALPEPQSA